MTECGREGSLSNRNQPLVSVVMGTFNGEKYLRSAIESILQQTFRDFDSSLGDGGVIATIKGLSSPGLIAFNGGNTWVTEGPANTVSTIRAYFAEEGLGLTTPREKCGMEDRLPWLWSKRQNA